MQERREQDAAAGEAEGGGAGERPGSRGLLRALRAVLRGEALDFTRVGLGRAIFLLAVPMVLEMSMESLFALVDTWFVGRLGAQAVAVVGTSSSLVTIVFALALGLSMAATAMVARRVGEGDVAAASRVAGQSIVAGLVTSLPVAVVGVVYAEELLLLLGADAGTAALGRGYNAVLIGGNATIFLLFLVNAVFRGAGDPALAMRSLWLANAINIALDPLLIFGWGPVPALGVTGAAVATTVGRGVGVLYQLRLLHRGVGRLSVGLAELRLVPDVLASLYRIAGTGTLQMLIGTTSWVGLVRILNLFGAEVMAGYTIAVRIIIFVFLPAWGISNAAATLVGQNLGAGHPERARRSVWLTGAVTAGFLTLVAVVFLLAAEPLVAAFSDRPEVVGVAARCLRIVCLAYPFLGFGLAFVQAFNGAGDTRTPTWINLLCYWVVEVPLAWSLAVPLGVGPAGVFASIAVAQTGVALLGFVLFRRGTWRGRSV